MQKNITKGAQLTVRRSLLSVAVAGALFAPLAAHASVSVHGVVAGTLFTPPVISDSPTAAKPSSTVASVYQNAKVCFDLNDNGACDSNETSTFSAADGSFLISSHTPANLVAEISTASTNNGNAVAKRTVFRVAQAQISALTVNPLLPVNVAVTPLSTEILRTIENDGLTFANAQANLASRLGVTATEVISNPGKVTNSADQTAILTESNILTTRWTLAAEMVDNGDVSTAALAANPNATSPLIQIPEAQETAMNLEGIPRYDHIFIIMLENKATLSIKGSAWAPNINNYLQNGNQFVSYFATGNPSEPNYTALGGADDWGITDDNQWNCGATGADAVQDTVIPVKSAALPSSPFNNPCNQTTNHNIVGRANLFNALSSYGLSWRTYSESMNPGQDFRTDSVGDSTIFAPDHVYNGTLPNGQSAGNANLLLPLPASLYRTKHHPGMAYQNVRSAPEFNFSNRTLGGGQWDSVLLNSVDYPIPANYNLDQFGTDLQTGGIGNVNFVIPDQCDDMHGISVTGKLNGASTPASDCSSVSNNVASSAFAPIITRGDNYVKTVISKIQASPIWTNPNKRVAIVIMFDEGNATSGFNSCCGWNPLANNVGQSPLLVATNGAVSQDTSVVNYYQGNRGHGESVFGVLNNHMNNSVVQGNGTAPSGIYDSDYYSHFSFVRTLQDMFGLANPDVDTSYMNRSKYTEAFIAANALNLPEYNNAADTHFNAVRPMNHAYVIPANYTLKQSSDVNTAPQTGPDPNQINLWSLK